MNSRIDLMFSRIERFVLYLLTIFGLFWNRTELTDSKSKSVRVHTDKSFWNLIKSTRNQIVFTIFRLIWIQIDVRLDPNQSKNGKYNLILGWFNKISKRFICVCSSWRVLINRAPSFRPTCFRPPVFVQSY